MTTNESPSSEYEPSDEQAERDPMTDYLRPLYFQLNLGDTVETYLEAALRNSPMTEDILDDLRFHTPLRDMEESMAVSGVIPPLTASAELTHEDPPFTLIGHLQGVGLAHSRHQVLWGLHDTVQHIRAAQSLPITTEIDATALSQVPYEDIIKRRTEEISELVASIYQVKSFYDESLFLKSMLIELGIVTMASGSYRLHNSVQQWLEQLRDFIPEELGPRRQVIKASDELARFLNVALFHQDRPAGLSDFVTTNPALVNAAVRRNIIRNNLSAAHELIGNIKRGPRGAGGARDSVRRALHSFSTLDVHRAFESALQGEEPPLIVDWEIFEYDHELDERVKRITELVATTSRSPEARGTKVNEDRKHILTSLRASWETAIPPTDPSDHPQYRHARYAYGNVLNRKKVRQEGKEYPDEYIVLLLYQGNAVIAAVAESMVVKNALYIYRADCSPTPDGSRAYTWGEAMSVTKLKAQEMNVRKVVHRRKEGVNLVTHISTRCWELLHTSPEVFRPSRDNAAEALGNTALMDGDNPSLRE